MRSLTGRALTGRERRRASIGLAAATVLCLVLAVSMIVRSPAGTSPGGDGQPQTAAVAVDGASPLNPAHPIVVRARQGSLTAVKVVDAASGKAVAGALAPDGRSWTSTGALAYGSRYAVGVDAAGPTGAPSHQDDTVTTLSPAQLAYPSFIPPPSATSVGVGQPLVVKFDHPVKDRAATQKALTVTTQPAQTGGWYWLSDTEVHYRPQTYWAPGTTITLAADVFGVDLGDGVYGKTSRTETVHVHDAWVAKADGATEQMQVFDDGKLVDTMPISLGSPGFPSHVGPHVISDKQPSVVMDSCTYGICPPDPRSYKETVDLDERISNDGEFVHSAPWSVGSQGDENVSHGCVNLSPANAQWFFDHFGVGDVVEISDSGGATLPMGDTYGDWELSWNQWRAGSAA
jgi:lipoprotein-anchoring transpeptidase ErfK/SrfK